MFLEACRARKVLSSVLEAVLSTDVHIGHTKLHTCESISYNRLSVLPPSCVEPNDYESLLSLQQDPRNRVRTLSLPDRLEMSGAT